MKKCLQCGIEFKPTGRNTKYCSRACYLVYNAAHLKIYIRTWRKRHPYKHKVFVDKNCEFCGKVFTPRSANNICCSQKCSNKRLYLRRKSRRPLKLNWKDKLLLKGACECCSYAIKPALHGHHLSKDKYDIITLCANCHYIFHSLVDIKLAFSYKKEQVLKIIQDYINK